MNKPLGGFLGVSLQPPSTFVQLLLVGSDFCPGGRTPATTWQIQHCAKYNIVIVCVIHFRLRIHKQEAQLMLTTGSTRLAVSRGQ